MLSLPDLKAIVVECEDECENAGRKGADGKKPTGCHSQIRIPLDQQLPENKSDRILDQCVVCGKYFPNDLQHHVAVFQKALKELKTVGKGLSIQVKAAESPSEP